MCISIVASAFQYGWAPTLMPGDHDVDLAAGLGELDDPPQHGGDPVHVLGAAVHRDPRAGREREPLERHAERLGEVERGDDAPALRLGQRAERLGRVAEQDDAQHALGVALGDVADDADDDAGGVGADGPVDGDQARRRRRGRAP